MCMYEGIYFRQESKDWKYSCIVVVREGGTETA